MENLTIIVMVLVLLAQNISAGGENSMIMLDNMNMPEESCQLKVQWGSYERTFSINSSISDVKISFPAANIRGPILIIIESNSKTLFKLKMIPTPLGYKLQEFFADENVKFSSNRIGEIMERLTTVDLKIVVVPPILNPKVMVNEDVVPAMANDGSIKILKKLIIDAGSSVSVKIKGNNSELMAEITPFSDTINVVGRIQGLIEKARIEAEPRIEVVRIPIEVPYEEGASQLINSLKAIYWEGGRQDVQENIVTSPSNITMLPSVLASIAQYKAHITSLSLMSAIICALLSFIIKKLVPLALLLLIVSLTIVLWW